MKQTTLRWPRISVAVCLAGMLTVAFSCSSLHAGEGENRRVLTIKPASAATASNSGMNVFKVDGSGLPWMDLAAIIGDVKGEIRVTGTIPLPDDSPKAAGLEEGSVIRTFQDKPVTTAADMIAQYDKLKTGETVALSFELKGQTGVMKFLKPKSSGNCIMIKK